MQQTKYEIMITVNLDSILKLIEQKKLQRGVNDKKASKQME